MNTQIFIYWNGAHWVARLDDRTNCGRLIESGALVYVLRGGYVRESLTKSEIIRIEE